MKARKVAYLDDDSDDLLLMKEIFENVLSSIDFLPFHTPLELYDYLREYNTPLY